MICRAWQAELQGQLQWRPSGANPRSRTKQDCTVFRGLRQLSRWFGGVWAV